MENRIWTWMRIEDDVDTERCQGGRIYIGGMECRTEWQFGKERVCHTLQRAFLFTWYCFQKSPSRRSHARCLIFLLRGTIESLVAQLWNSKSVPNRKLWFIKLEITWWRTKYQTALLLWGIVLLDLVSPRNSPPPTTALRILSVKILCFHKIRLL